MKFQGKWSYEERIAVPMEGVGLKHLSAMGGRNPVPGREFSDLLARRSAVGASQLRLLIVLFEALISVASQILSLACIVPSLSMNTRLIIVIDFVPVGNEKRREFIENHQAVKKIVISDEPRSLTVVPGEKAGG